MNALIRRHLIARESKQELERERWGSDKKIKEIRRDGIYMIEDER